MYRLVLSLVLDRTVGSSGDARPVAMEDVLGVFCSTAANEMVVITCKLGSLRTARRNAAP